MTDREAKARTGLVVMVSHPCRKCGGMDGARGKGSGKGGARSPAKEKSGLVNGYTAFVAQFIEVKCQVHQGCTFIFSG